MCILDPMKKKKNSPIFIMEVNAKEIAQYIDVYIRPHEQEKSNMLTKGF